MERLFGRPGQHYDAAQLDHGTTFVASDAEKVMAVLVARLVATYYGFDSAIMWTTGNYRGFLGDFFDLGYMDKIAIVGQDVRSVVVGKLAGLFALSWQSPIAPFRPIDIDSVLFGMVPQALFAPVVRYLDRGIKRIERQLP